MSTNNQYGISLPIKYGLLAGAIALSLSMIGMVASFSERDLIAGVLTLGQVILFLAPAALSYLAASKAPSGKNGTALLYGAITGFFAALPLIALVYLGTVIDLRQYFPNVSPALMDILTFGQGPGLLGSLILLIFSTLLGLVSAGLYLLPDKYRRPIMNGLVGTLVIGMFSEILTERLRFFFGARFVGIIITSKALRPVTAIVIFLVITVFSYFWRQRSPKTSDTTSKDTAKRNPRLRYVWIVLILVGFLILPLLAGTYLSEVINNVLIFALMGFGLNIVVGFAGLLDLGYVAFFAIGAYTMAILTSEGALGVGGFSFWLALPICVAIAVLAGIMLGIPVLRMRGDYLAIVTLGFGEIIRILALSDLLKPYIGGAQGVLQIPKPTIIGLNLISPDQFYYVVFAGCLLAAFVSWRLSGARLGRQWMAMREDEDVAEAMGIKLVNSKLLAFAIGASFAGLAGAIFASKLTSIFPHSFNLLISINVLCLIIVGGLGSLPGVVVGALFLVGLPELLREFAEYRMLMYGMLLIVMMLLKPEGLWPSAVRKRELHIYEEDDSARRTSIEPPPKAETRDPGLAGTPHL